MNFILLGEKSKYKLYRNEIVALSRLSKQLYYQNFFENNITNMKKTWEGINSLMNRKKKRGDVITALKRPGGEHISQNPKDFPDILNTYFATVGSKLASGMPNAQSHFSSYLPNVTNSQSFFFDPVSPSEIQLEILLIPPNKAHGIYSCPPRLLKCASNILSVPLCKLINMSIINGVYPSKLKHAKVIPIFKSEDKIDPSNYRPISLLSIFNTIFEKLMYNRLKSFLDKHDIFHNSQYGFRERRSTEHALIDIVNHIQSNFDDGLFSCGIFIDLKKAFDTVDHSILLQKLYHYGIRGIINEWFHSYLTNRTQTTQIGSYISTKANVTCGVPQGSVLGPLLFLIYINDNYKSSNKFSFYLFADDTNLLYADRNLKSLENTVNLELIKVYEWLTANKLTVNLKKTNFVIFRPYQKKIDYPVNLKLFNNETRSFLSLEQKEYIKYLGIIIDSNLSWKYHVNHVALKISKTIGTIARLRHFVPTSTLLNIYRCLILPYLTYGISVWGQAAKTYINQILIQQKRVLRLIYFAPYRSHAIHLFLSSNCLPFNMLYFSSVSSLMHDVANNVTPSNITNLFEYSSKFHNYNTRFSSKGNFHIKYSRSLQLNKSFSRSGGKIWNCIPDYLKSLPKKSFKMKIRDLLLNILSEEDDYPTISDLLTKLAKLQP